MVAHVAHKLLASAPLLDPNPIYVNTLLGKTSEKGDTAQVDPTMD